LANITLGILIITAILMATLVFHYLALPAPGPTGLVGTSVRLESGRVVECVAARDVYGRTVAVGVTCDWGRP